MLVTVALAVSLALSDELLTNGGFEARPTRDDPVPGWVVDIGAQNGAQHPESELELDRQVRRGGKHSLHLSGDRNTRAWKILKHELPVRPGGRYHLKAQVKTEAVEPNGFGLDNCYLGLFFFDADGKLAGRELVWPKRPEQDWKAMDVRVNAPPTARTGYVYVFLSMIGHLWVDDLELDIKGGEKLQELERVYFEDFETLRKLPSKWSREVGATNGEGGKESRIEVDSDLGALAISGDLETLEWWIVGPELKAKEGELYRFSAKVKAEEVRREGPQFSNLHLSLAFFDRRKELIGKARFADAGSGSFDWSSVSVEAVSPPETRSVRARVFLSMSGRAWFDDLEIRRLEDVPLPYSDWETIETDDVVLRFASDHPKAATMKAYAARLDQSKAEICRQLEVDFSEKITVFLYKNVEEGRLLTGGTLDFADPAGRKVHQRYNSYIAHEMVHVIAHTRLQYAGTGLLGEGIAVWLNGQSPEVHHRKASQLLQDGELPSLDDLLTRFREQEQGYPAAGSFCGYLLETVGLETFKVIYPTEDPSSALQAEVGQTLEELEPGWHAELASYR